MIYDAAIIGLGPVGATLALLLARRGARVVVVERETSAYGLPRAVQLDDEALCVLALAGVDDQVLRAGRPNTGTMFMDAEGEVLVDWSRPTGTGAFGYPPSLRFHQPDLERILRRALADTDAHLQLGVEMRALSEGDGVVRLATSGGDITARHVIGCDGARSAVRRALGVGAEDLGFAERWLVADLILTRPRPDLPTHTLQICDATSPATYVCGVGDRRRWEIRLTPSDPDHLTDAQVWARLARWITPDEAKLERAALYTFRSVLADQWRVGNVFLAGDAAHQTPPFMGQGLCHGLRDAASLFWRLETVGAAYEAERKPHARQFIERAIDMGRMLNRTAESALIGAADTGPATPRLGRLAPRLGGFPEEAPAPVGRLAPFPPAFTQAHLKDGRLHAASHADISVWLRPHGAAAAQIRPDLHVGALSQV